MTGSGRRSSFDLTRAANYLRLAYQAMSHDQDAAIEAIEQMAVIAQRDPINRVLGLSGLCAGAARRLADEAGRSA